MYFYTCKYIPKPTFHMHIHSNKENIQKQWIPILPQFPIPTKNKTSSQRSSIRQHNRVELGSNTGTRGLPVYTFWPHNHPYLHRNTQRLFTFLPRRSQGGSEAAGQISVYIIGAFVPGVCLLWGYLWIRLEISMKLCVHKTVACCS